MINLIIIKYNLLQHAVSNYKYAPTNVLENEGIRLHWNRNIYLFIYYLYKKSEKLYILTKFESGTNGVTLLIMY